MKRKIYITITIMLLVMGNLSINTYSALGDDGYAGGVGENPMPRNSKDIAMDSEVVNVILHEGFAEVECAYRFRNEGDDQTVIMGFPNKIEIEYGGLGSSLVGIGIFRAFVDDKELPVTLSELTFKPNQREAELYGEQSTWFFHNVTFEKGETKVVINKYIADHGGSSTPVCTICRSFGYVLKTGSSWKGKIGRADINISYAGGVSWDNFFIDPDSFKDFGEMPSKDPYSFFSIHPKGFRKEYNGLSWSFTNIEPGEDNNIWMSLYFNYNKTGPRSREARASSWLNAGNYKYSAKQAFDDSVETAWAEGKPGSGVGETLKVVFNQRKIYRELENATVRNEIENNVPYIKKIAEIRILPGYMKSRELYYKYSRPKKITAIFSNGKQMQMKLADDPSLQYFTLNKPVKARWVKLRIDDVYEGNTGKDTYISEVEFGSEKTKMPKRASALLSNLPITNSSTESTETDSAMTTHTDSLPTTITSTEDLKDSKISKEGANDEKNVGKRGEDVKHIRFVIAIILSMLMIGGSIMAVIMRRRSLQ